ncbi:MAG TPA: RNase adapter RapZ, partial [Pyrinomonadaceae bacterium]|nr:RNase adapter RapZ [Pyrinomonadaceae bacterium]
AQPEVEETLERFSDLLLYLLPQYQREGKSYLTVGIGCTGGRHRSVMIANEIAGRLKRAGFEAQAVHRDMRKGSMGRKKATR